MPPSITYSEESYAHNRKNLFILSIVGFCGLIILAIILMVINFQKTATLDIVIAPINATVSIDGHQFKTKETVKYYPGSYTAEISADGFISQALPIELIADQESHLYIALEPTEENSTYYDNNPNESGRRQAVYDAAYQLGSDEYIAKYPIIQVLPYQNTDRDRGYDFTNYRIDYGIFDGCRSNFCIKITDNVGVYQNEAIEYLKSSGQNINDYEIIYEYTGPEETKQLISKYPILKYLPIQVEYFSNNYAEHTQYTINYSYENNQFRLIINDASGNSHKIALQKIEELGYNPNDYNIIYNNVSSEYQSYRAPNDAKE